MAISTTPVQQVQAVASSGSSIAVTIATPAAGNFLAVLIQGNVSGNSVSSISQTNVTWSAAVVKSSNRRFGEIWAAGNVSGSAGTTVTVNFASALTLNTSVWVVEFSGVATSSFTDQSISNDGASSTVSVTGTITPTSGRNIVILCCHRCGNTPITAGPSSGFTALTTSNGNLQAFYGVVASSTGSYSNSITLTGSSTFEAQIADFMAPAGGFTWQQLAQPYDPIPAPVKVVSY